MNWNVHSRLEGLHAFLSASKHSWVNYDDEKLGEAFRTAQAAAMGTRLHALAAEHIRPKDADAEEQGHLQRLRERRHWLRS